MVKKNSLRKRHIARNVSRLRPTNMQRTYATALSRNIIPGLSSLFENPPPGLKMDTSIQQFIQFGNRFGYKSITTDRDTGSNLLVSVVGGERILFLVAREKKICVTRNEKKI